MFAEKDTYLGCTDTIKMSIDTDNHTPMKQKPYHTPLTKRKIVDVAIDDILQANMIRPNNSPWASAIVVVDKKDDSKRFCVDYREHNKGNTLSSWPLLVIDDLLASFGKTKYFTCLVRILASSS